MTSNQEVAKVQYIYYEEDLPNTYGCHPVIRPRNEFSEGPLQSDPSARPSSFNGLNRLRLVGARYGSLSEDGVQGPIRSQQKAWLLTPRSGVRLHTANATMLISLPGGRSLNLRNICRINLDFRALCEVHYYSNGDGNACVSSYFPHEALVEP